MAEQILLSVRQASIDQSLSSTRHEQTILGGHLESVWAGFARSCLVGLVA